MATLHLTFWGTAKLFFKVAEPFYNHTSNVWGFQFFHIVIVYLFDFRHPNGCEVVPHHGFVFPW